MFIRVGRATVAVVAVYGALVLLLVPVLPFWLDEVLQLLGTDPRMSLREVLAYVPQNPGGVPLGYVFQHWVLQVAGSSRWTARALSAVFGVATCAAVAILADRLGLRHS